MIYRAPVLTEEDRGVLRLIEVQKETLRLYTQFSPSRWAGSLRRSTFARAIQGSNSIEGYHASIDDALAAVEGEPMDERTETEFAVRGYRDAITYVMQAAQDPTFEFGKQFLKSLHFMITGFDMRNFPGQWRRGSVRVVNSTSGEVVYEAPDAELVDRLIGELVAGVVSQERGQDVEHPIVLGAMAHLNMTMIHPFKDGNGRMARAVQTLVLSRQGTLHPIFSSIEEWLGRNTQQYYDVLAETGMGIWNPQRDASAWLRFCLKAHYQQAATLIRRNEEYGALFDEVAKLTKGLGLPERANVPLFDAALGFRVKNLRYRTDAEVTEFVASRDLRRLVDLALLLPKGEKRGRSYTAGPALQALRAATRLRRPVADPYAVLAALDLAASLGPMLPGLSVADTDQ